MGHSRCQVGIVLRGVDRGQAANGELGSFRWWTYVSSTEARGRSSTTNNRSKRSVSGPRDLPAGSVVAGPVRNQLSPTSSFRPQSSRPLYRRSRLPARAHFSFTSASIRLR